MWEHPYAVFVCPVAFGERPESEVSTGSTVTGRATARVRCEPGFYTQCLSISGAGLGFNRLESEPCENGYLWSVMAVSTLVLDMAKA